MLTKRFCVVHLLQHLGKALWKRVQQISTVRYNPISYEAWANLVSQELGFIVQLVNKLKTVQAVGILILTVHTEDAKKWRNMSVKSTLSMVACPLQDFFGQPSFPSRVPPDACTFFCGLAIFLEDIIILSGTICENTLQFSWIINEYSMILVLIRCVAGRQRFQ